MSQDWRDKCKRFYQQKKPIVQCKQGTRMPNSMLLHLNLEDHTMGQLIRIALLTRKDVKFAGYRVLHPLDNKVQVRVQTVSDKAPTQKVVCQTLDSLSKDVQQLIKKVDELQV